MNINGHALVVGGGSGIGRACSIMLAKEGATGILIADVAIHAAIAVAQECKNAATSPDFRVETVSVDVTQEDSVRELFRGMVAIFGRLDYCINCAGIGVQTAVDIASLSLADFQRFMDVNTTGVFLVTREASITMRSQEPWPILPSEPKRGNTRGAIVNLGSGSSMVATAGVLPYTASKHAALGISKNSALDNAAFGIRVNCVCPSWVDTPMVQSAMEGVEGLASFIERAVPIGRIAQPEEVADTVVFLCSSRSSYITGCGLLVDAGTTLTASR